MFYILNSLKGILSYVVIPHSPSQIITLLSLETENIADTP